MHTMLVLGLAAFVLMLAPRPAFAYLDAGSGSYFIQIIIGVAVGGLVAIKVYFRKIQSFATRLFRRKDRSA